MIELRNGAGFAVKALAELRIGGQGFGQDLDRDRAIEACVARFVDLSHPARTERRDYFVRTEASTGRKSQCAV